MKAEDTMPAIFKPAFQRNPDGSERDFFPWNSRFLKECYFQAFLAGREVQIAQPCQIKQMHLIHMGYG